MLWLFRLGHFDATAEWVSLGVWAGPGLLLALADLSASVHSLSLAAAGEWVDALGAVGLAELAKIFGSCSWLLLGYAMGPDYACSFLLLVYLLLHVVCSEVCCTWLACCYCMLAC